MAFLRAALPLLLLVALAPLSGAHDTCEHVRSVQANVFTFRVTSVDQKCHWHDLRLGAEVTERVERHEVHDVSGEEERHVLTYYEQALERRFQDGRTTFLHRTYVLAADAFLQHDYLERRDADGRTTCSGAAEGDPPAVPGRLSVPATPAYPACAPPGLLA